MNQYFPCQQVIAMGYSFHRGGMHGAWRANRANSHGNPPISWGEDIRGVGLRIAFRYRADAEEVLAPPVRRH
jgi:hypothetical protein